MWSSRCIRWYGVVHRSFSYSYSYSQNQRKLQLVHGRLSSNAAAKTSRVPDDGLELKDFVRNSQAIATGDDSVPTAATGESEPAYAFHASRSTEPDERQRSFYLETYGCQMNVSDSEIVHSILEKNGIHKTDKIEDADILLVNTCSIREKAEERVWNRLYEFRALQRKEKRSKPRIVGVLGCMAERLKEKLLEKDKLVDVVVGPDAYRDLPRLLERAEDGDAAINTLLSLDETYADVAPVRTAENRVSAYVSIMRGCNNMCSYCIVPWTRGRERSRHIQSILDEVKALSDAGFKEVTLLGQNVNSYNDVTSAEKRSYSLPEHNLSNEGFTQKSKLSQIGVRFPELLRRVSEVDPEMRIRFTSPHPKDFPMDLLKLISERANLCKQLHIPAQSGSSRVLELMRRDYSRESYIELIDNVRKVLPNVSLSSDFISGFCGERDEDHAQTLDLLRYVKYDAAFMFAFSQRERTHAHRKLVDDVPQRVKLQRLEEVRDTFIDIAKRESQHMVDTVQLALVEGRSKRSADHFSGRIDSNKKVIFPKKEVPASLGESTPVTIVPGDYVVVRITSATQASLSGEPLARTSLADFHWLMTNCLFFNGDIFKPSKTPSTAIEK